MKLSNAARKYLAQQLAHAQNGYPGNLSPDGKAVFLHGGLGYGCYFSPDGDVILEVYEIGDAESRYDRSKRGRISAITMSLPHHPVLAELLPLRTEDAVTCAGCAGSGFTDLGALESFLLSQDCCGLGWTSPTVFND